MIVLWNAGSPRWGNPFGQPFGYYPFGVDFHAHMSADGITALSAFAASWFAGTQR